MMLIWLKEIKTDNKTRKDLALIVTMCGSWEHWPLVRQQCLLMSLYSTLIFNRKQGQEMCTGLGCWDTSYALTAGQTRADIQHLVGFVLAQGWPILGLERPRQISWLITSNFCHNKQRSFGKIEDECYLRSVWRKIPPLKTLIMLQTAVEGDIYMNVTFQQLLFFFYSLEF